MRSATLPTMLFCWATAAAADQFQPLTEPDDFLNALGGRDLTHRLYNLKISVDPAGTINGSAMGWDITGEWAWKDGYFCRVMDWGGSEIPYNCQLVELDGDTMRFTSDQGQGDSAAFRLR